MNWLHLMSTFCDAFTLYAPSLELPHLIVSMLWPSLMKLFNLPSRYRTSCNSQSWILLLNWTSHRLPSLFFSIVTFELVAIKKRVGNLVCNVESPSRLSFQNFTKSHYQLWRTCPAKNNLLNCYCVSKVPPHVVLIVLQLSWGSYLALTISFHRLLTSCPYIHSPLRSFWPKTSLNYTLNLNYILKLFFLMENIPQLFKIWQLSSFC